MEIEEEGTVHVWVGVMMLFGLYLFYLVEKILNMILAKQKVNLKIEFKKVKFLIEFS